MLDAGNVATIVFLHHHVVPIGYRWLDELRLKDVNELENVLAGCSGPTWVVSGHVHMSTMTTKGSVTWLTTAATSYQFEPNDKPATSGSPVAIRVIDIESGTPRTTMVPIPNSGKVPD